MRSAHLALVSSSLVSTCLAALLAPAHAGTDTARLLAADRDKADWLMNGRTYAADRFSPLDEINAANVKTLVPRWIYQTGKPSTFQATPLVADGVLYLSEPMSSVTALDAKTGRKLWHYEHKSAVKKICCGPANRGVALGDGRVYVATVDARLIAIDAMSGKVVWDVLLAKQDDEAAEDKAMLGRLELPPNLRSELENEGYTLLDVRSEHAEGLRAFPELTRHDPFDRLLVAQAHVERMPLLTADRVLLSLRRDFVVDATV